MPPYNTRRKSLSLSELGIILPKRSRAIEQHPSPPETVVEGEEPPVKRSKRAHESRLSPLGLMSPPRTTSIRIKQESPKSVSALSPPPSPATETINRVDIEGINDDIVVATIQQLERTGNRPHLVRELAAILASNVQPMGHEEMDIRLNTDVANKITRSANPCALISSRLTAYLNRPWPAISPCPLAKDLSSAHPRRLYFFLTTTPRQPIPNVVEAIPKAARIISPSLSSASADEEDPRFARGRQAMSPSPEVDLSSPELDDTNPDAPPTPGASFSSRSSLPRDQPPLPHPRRAASPQLEYDERDFKQTASQCYEQAQARRNSQLDVNMSGVAASPPSASSSFSADDPATTFAVAAAAAATDDPDTASVTMSIEADESEESAARRDSEAAVALFGPVDPLRLPAFLPPLPHHGGNGGSDDDNDGSVANIHSRNASAGHMDFSSPMLHPQTDDESRLRFAPTTTSSFPSSRDTRVDESVGSLVLGSLKDVVLPGPALWDEHLECPENVEMEELEDMFDAY